MTPSTNWTSLVTERTLSPGNTSPQLVSDPAANPVLNVPYNQRGVYIPSGTPSYRSAASQRNSRPSRNNPLAFCHPRTCRYLSWDCLSPYHLATTWPIVTSEAQNSLRKARQANHLDNFREMGKPVVPVTAGTSTNLVPRPTVPLHAPASQKFNFVTDIGEPPRVTHLAGNAERFV